MDEISKASGVDRHAFSPQRHFRRLRSWEWAALVLVPVLATLSLGYLHLTSPPPCISRSSYERITAGMTERDVHRIIRARPGGYHYFVNEGELLVQEWGS